MRRLFLVPLLGLSLCFSGCSAALPDFTPFETEEATASFAEDTDQASAAPLITLERRRYSFTGDSEAILVKGDLLIIRRAGTYRLKGELTEGGIEIDAGPDGVVRLVLEGVSIHASTHSAIFVKSAAAVVLRTEKDSVNLLTSDGESVLSAHANLVFRGEGSLSLSGARIAVEGSDTVSVESGLLRMTASRIGMVAEKRLTVLGGEVAVNAAELGYVTREAPTDAGGIFLRGGRVTAVCSEAALSATTRILLENGAGSFEAPTYYRCGFEENGKAVKGRIEYTGGSFPPIPS